MTKFVELRAPSIADMRRSPLGGMLTREGITFARRVRLTLPRSHYTHAICSPRFSAMQTLSIFLERSRNPILLEFDREFALPPQRRKEWEKLVGQQRPSLREMRAAHPVFVDTEVSELSSWMETVVDSIEGPLPRTHKNHLVLCIVESPILEAIVQGTTGEWIAPVGPCEGVLLEFTRRGQAKYQVQLKDVLRTDSSAQRIAAAE